MYDLIDRPIASLAPGGRFLLWAMRGWIQSAGKGQCPPSALAPAFAKHGVLPALPPFHMLLADLNRHALRGIAFAPLACMVIGDDEAVLLQLCRDAITLPSRARVTVELLLEEDAVGSSFSALLLTMKHLSEGGLGAIAFQPDHAARAE